MAVVRAMATEADAPALVPVETEIISGWPDSKNV